MLTGTKFGMGDDVRDDCMQNFITIRWGLLQCVCIACILESGLPCLGRKRSNILKGNNSVLWLWVQNLDFYKFYQKT